jgi:hypothetical protein
VTVRVHPGAVVVRILAVTSAWPVKRSSRFLRERGSGDLTGSVHRPHAAAGASRDPPAGGPAEVVGGRIVGARRARFGVGWHWVLRKGQVYVRLAAGHSRVGQWRLVARWSARTPRPKSPAGQRHRLWTRPVKVHDRARAFFCRPGGRPIRLPASCTPPG